MTAIVYFRVIERSKEWNNRVMVFCFPIKNVSLITRWSVQWMIKKTTDMQQANWSHFYHQDFSRVGFEPRLQEPLCPVSRRFGPLSHSFTTFTFGINCLHLVLSLLTRSFSISLKSTFVNAFKLQIK